MDWQTVRSHFPITQEYLFFDLANKCALPYFATRAIQAYAEKQARNSGDKGEWFRTIEEARERFAQLVNAYPTEVAILKNTSEGLNVAANGIPFKAGENVVVNLSEHPNNIYCWRTCTGGVSRCAGSRLAMARSRWMRWLRPSTSGLALWPAGIASQ